MGQILDFIDKNNSGDFHCYRTRKLSLDDTMGEQFTHESYDRDSMSKDTSGKKYAETDTTNISSVEIPQKLIQSPFSNNIISICSFNLRSLAAADAPPATPPTIR